MTPDSEHQDLSRNFWLGVVSGVAYNLYIAILSTELVMTWFVSELTHSNLLISLLVPIEYGSWYFLQLLVSGYVQRTPRVLSLYRLMAVVRLVALTILTVATFTLEEPNALLVIFLAMFTLNNVAAGVAALPFLNVIAKTVPPTRRGMYFGWRRFIGGCLGLLGGALVRIVLSSDFGLTFPDNYALLFFLGLLITAVLVLSFSLIKEPAEAVDSRRISLPEQLRRAIRLPAQDGSYKRYLRLRVVAVVASFALPFYTVYARRVLDAPDGMVGTYLIGLTLAGVLSNLILGRIGDRRGNRLLMRLVAYSAVLPPSLALFIAHLPATGLDKSLIFSLVFVSQGVHYTANAIGSNNYVMELAPPTRRAIYVGYANGLVGLTVFASPLGGVIVDHLGFIPLFTFSLICSLVAVTFSLGLEEPRKLNNGPQQTVLSDAPTTR